MGVFVGEERAAVVDALVATVDGLSGPQLVTLTGAIGSGKSRIVQELYARMAARQPTPAYWPDAISDDRAGSDPGVARKRVAPPSFSVPPTAEIPFLWWGVSCERRQSGGLSAALLHDAEQLYLHALSIHARWGRGRRLVASVSDPAARDRAFKIAGLAVTLAGPLGIVAGAATTMGMALSARDASDLARTGAEALKKRRSSADSDDRGRSIDAGASIEERQLELAEDLATMLCGSVSGSPALPTVVAIDDAHWADQGVLHLVRRILEHADAPILIVATAWPGELAQQRRAKGPIGLASIIDAIGPQRCTTIALPELGPADLADIVGEMAPRTDASVSSALSTRADGNPLALRLLLAQQMVQMAIADDRIDLTIADVTRLPSEIESLHRQLWNELPHGVRTTLAAAACVHDQLVTPVVVAAASELGVEGPSQDLEDAASIHGWVRRVAEDLYEFTESSRRTIAADPGNLPERSRALAREVSAARSVELVRTGWAGSLAGRRALFSEVVDLTEQGVNHDLVGAHAAANQQADLLRRAHDLVEQRRLLELAVAWGEQSHGEVAAADQLSVVVELGRVAGYLGDVEVRDQMRRMGHELASSIAAASPDDPVALDELSESFVRMGDSAAARLDLDAAADLFAQAEAYARSALALDPERASTLSSLVYAHDRLGDVAKRRQRPQEALGWYRTGLDLARQGAAMDPEDGGACRELAFAASKVGHLALELGDVDEAAARFAEARAVLEGRLAADPDDDWAKRILARVHSELADLARALGDGSTAAVHAATCLDLRRVLVEVRPDDRAVVRELARTLELSATQVRQEDPALARSHYEEGISLLEALEPPDVASLLVMGQLLNNLARVDPAAGIDAEAVLRRSISVAEAILEIQPDERGALDSLAYVYEQIGELEHARGQCDLAVRAFRASAHARDRVLKLDRASATARRRLALILRKLGREAHSIGRLREAADALAASAALTAVAATDRPDDEHLVRELAKTRSQLARVASELGDNERARAELERALPGWRTLLAAEPSSATRLRDVAACLDRLGDVLLRLDEVDGALRRHEEARSIRADLAVRAPSDAQSFRDLTYSLSKLASTARRMGDADLVRRFLGEGVEAARRWASLEPGNAAAAQLAANLEADLAAQGAC